MLFNYEAHCYISFQLTDKYVPLISEPQGNNMDPAKIVETLKMLASVDDEPGSFITQQL